MFPALLAGLLFSELFMLNQTTKGLDTDQASCRREHGNAQPKQAGQQHQLFLAVVSHQTRSAITQDYGGAQQAPCCGERLPKLGRISLRIPSMPILHQTPLQDFRCIINLSPSCTSGFTDTSSWILWLMKGMLC